MKSLSSFFHSDSGAMSMSRLLMFGSFCVTSVLMILIWYAGNMNEGYFSMYLGAYAGTYLVGKGIDMKAGNTAAGKGGK